MSGLKNRVTACVTGRTNSPLFYTPFLGSLWDRPNAHVLTPYLGSVRRAYPSNARARTCARARARARGHYFGGAKNGPTLDLMLLYTI